LLVERTDEFWSFSHLTFQEYFTAYHFAESGTSAALEKLATHITQTHWREVFLLATELLPSADQLLRLIKQQIDGLLAGDENLQQFLGWVDEKARSVDAPYKPAAVRAFYFAIARSRSRSRSSGATLTSPATSPATSPSLLS
jgi:predicted NACHT family NTPase